MDCLFCSLPDKQNILADYPEKKIILESENFYAKPALGSFIEGYCLIFSKDHIKSFSFLDTDEVKELESFKLELSSKLKKLYNKPLMCFEHGLVNLEYEAGCCIDHAHCHIIPTDIEILEDLKKIFSFTVMESLHDLKKFSTNQVSYILYEVDTEKKYYIFMVDKELPTQFVRRIICNKLGIGEQWNCMYHPFRDKIISFLDKYLKVETPIRK